MSKLFKEGITFARYSAAGISAFIFELGLLYVLLRLLEGTSYFSVAIAFVIATVFQYGICHLWVFGSSRRPMRIEYIYFASIMFGTIVGGWPYCLVCGYTRHKRDNLTRNIRYFHRPVGFLSECKIQLPRARFFATLVIKTQRQISTE